MMIDILVINLNCLEHTKNILSDINRQTYKNFSITLIDQNSSESGTKDFLDSLISINVIQNNCNVSINKLWNDFVSLSKKKIVCILNNDIRIPKNFLQDIINIFDKEKNVGAVIHPTNHPTYSRTIPDTTYKLLPRGKHMQGWDICMRRIAWTTIPEDFKIFCGDDFIFLKMYEMGFDVAIAISSPIIHYRGATMKSFLNKDIPMRGWEDVQRYREMGLNHNLHPPLEYCIVEFYNSPIDSIQETF